MMLRNSHLLEHSLRLLSGQRERALLALAELGSLLVELLLPLLKKHELSECGLLVSWSRVRDMWCGYLDGADVLLAEALQWLDDLLVRAPQLQHRTRQ